MRGLGRLAGAVVLSMGAAACTAPGTDGFAPVYLEGADGVFAVAFRALQENDRRRHGEIRSAAGEIDWQADRWSAIPLSLGQRPYHRATLKRHC